MDRNQLFNVVYRIYTYVAHMFTIVASSAWAARTAGEAAAHAAQVAQSAVRAAGAAAAAGFSAMSSAYIAEDAARNLAEIEADDTSATAALASASEMSYAAKTACERAVNTSQVAIAAAKDSLARMTVLQARAALAERFAGWMMYIYLGVLALVVALAAFVHGVPLWTEWRAHRAAERRRPEAQAVAARIPGAVVDVVVVRQAAWADIAAAMDAFDAAREVLHNAQADVDVARADMTIAQAEVNAARHAKDARREAVAQADVDAARADMDAAQAAVDAARANLEAAHVNVNVVLAPLYQAPGHHALDQVLRDAAARLEAVNQRLEEDQGIDAGNDDRLRLEAAA